MVRLPVVIRHTAGSINVNQNRGIILLESAGNLDSLRRRESPTARNLDLGARSIELGPHILMSRMQRQKLNPQEIMPGSNTARHSEIVPPLALDHIIDAPDSGRGIEVILGDLEPIETLVRSSRRVVHLGEVRRHGPVVGGRDGVVRVSRELGAADDVLPPGADFGAGGDFDDGFGLGGYDAAG